MLHSAKRLSQLLRRSRPRRLTSKAEPSHHVEDASQVDWLSVVGLDDFRLSLPSELSGGMRKRAELARAYAAEPKLLLLDEPFAGLDALTREEMQLVLERLWQGTKCTVIFVTHDWYEATAIADRIVVLTGRPGRVHEIIPVQLPRPRDATVRRSSEFLTLAARVADSVRELAHSNVDFPRSSVEVPTDG